MDVKPVTSKIVVLGIDLDNDWRKLCQLMFLRDGSLTVSFPYFQEAACQLAIGTMPGAPMIPHLTLNQNLWGSSHSVKYTHHLDGRAHFSQDGRIRTIVRRQSVPLTDADGHIFTFSVQGFSAFKALPKEQRHAPGARRTNLFFRFAKKSLSAIKLVGYVYRREKFLDSLVDPKPPVGPIMSLIGPDGQVRAGAIITAPNAPERILVVAAESIPPLNRGRPTMVFIAGFDPPELVNDYTRTSDFLFMASPPGDLERIIREYGTVDFTRGTR